MNALFDKDDPTGKYVPFAAPEGFGTPDYAICFTENEERFDAQFAFYVSDDGARVCFVLTSLGDISFNRGAQFVFAHHKVTEFGFRAFSVLAGGQYHGHSVQWRALDATLSEQERDSQTKLYKSVRFQVNDTLIERFKPYPYVLQTYAPSVEIPITASEAQTFLDVLHRIDAKARLIRLCAGSDVAISRIAKGFYDDNP